MACPCSSSDIRGQLYDRKGHFVACLNTVSKEKPENKR